MPTSDVQVFIEDFDSTLEVIADGTWNSGESLTVRLTNENLNTNTLTDQDMELGDDEPSNTDVWRAHHASYWQQIETVTRDADDPTALATDWLPPMMRILMSWAHCMKSTAIDVDNYTFTVTLTEAQKERLQDGTLGNYIHYSTRP